MKMNVSVVFLFSAVVIFNSFLFSSANPLALFGRSAYIPTVKLIRSHGYGAEAHSVQTEDGYLLEIHRIIVRKRFTLFNAQRGKNIPVLLGHGILGSSADYLLLKPNNSLAFMLADLGYDVWLGNLRGNRYGKVHTTLTPKESNFWNFSWHESGRYDLPAQVDYICSKTSAEKIFYIGYSLGTTLFFVMTSTLPAYNDKIEKAFLLAPLIQIKTADNPALKRLEAFTKFLKFVMDQIAYGEFSGRNEIVQKILNIFCLSSAERKQQCNSILVFLGGIDLDKYDRTRLSYYLQNYPAGYSAKGVRHFSQLLTSGKFRLYNYGWRENRRAYGKFFPPDYNLSAITAQMDFYVSRHDRLSTVRDNMQLEPKLTSLQEVHVVEEPDFNHLDFLISDKSANLIYENIAEQIGRSLGIPVLEQNGGQRGEAKRARKKFFWSS